MPRELEGYRDYLEQLSAISPNSGVLSVAAAAEFMGISIRSVYRNSEIPNFKGNVSKVAIAHWMADHYRMKKPRR